MSEFYDSLKTQKFYIERLLSNRDLFERSKNVLSIDLFDSQLKRSLEYVFEYIQKNNIPPSIRDVNAHCDIKFEDDTEKLLPEQQTSFLEEIEKFAQHQSIKNALIEAPDYIEKGEYNYIVDRIKDAAQLSIEKDLGIDYWEDPEKRLKSLLEKNAIIPTYWHDLDKKLYGGFKKGELSIFAGGSSSGKSLFLQNLSINWALKNLNVIYISLELSENLVGLRMDAMLTGKGTPEVTANIAETALAVKLKGKNAGEIQIKFMDSGSKTNDIEVYLKEYIIKRNVVPDAIMVDYMGLMQPNYARVNASDIFTIDKYVSEELRNLASKYNIAMISASQLNRDSVNETELGHNHIAGGISKINTADNVIGIIGNHIMRQNGEYQIQLLKTRTSAGGGQKISLAYNPVSMRIENDGHAKQSFAEKAQAKGTDIKNSLTKKVTPEKEPEPPKEPERKPRHVEQSVDHTAKKFSGNREVKDFLQGLGKK